MSLTIPGVEASVDDEQTFFDHVREVREATREARARAWQAAGNAKDRARLKANAEQDTTLGRPEDAAAFLRLDVEDGDCYYIGESGVSDDRGERLVYSWKAPLMLRLRGATHDDPRGVVRRRTFRTEPVNLIDGLDDLLLAELALQVAELGTTEPQLIASDAFLQSVLQRGRTPEMQTIVQTIQAAQADVIAADADQLLVVQGGPGTGKTAVALHRVAALLFGPLRDRSDKQVLVVGPNVTFLRYISRVVPELGEENVRQTDIGRLMGGGVTVNVPEQPAAARLKGDDRMVEVLARGLSDRIRPPQEPLSFGFDDVSWRVKIEPDEAARLIEDAGTAAYATGRARFRMLLENKIGTDARRRQRADRWVRSEAAPRPRAVEVEAAVERMWPQMTPAAYLRDLFGSTDRLVQAAGDALTAQEVRLLRRQASPRLSEQLWSKEDLPLLDQVAFEMNGEVETFAHIVVDEVQDLSPMQLQALRRRSSSGAMTIVGDIAQSTGHWARDSWDDIVDGLRSPLPTQTVQLEYGYRVPRSVMEVAARLLPEAAPGVASPQVVRDVEPGPRWHAIATDVDRYAHAVDVVREHSSKGLFVGVICPDEGRKPLESAFRAAGIMWNDADKGGLAAAINVVSPGASKGLEFDAAIVVDPQTIVDAGPHGLRMLYIALTRTTALLDIVHETGRLPRALASGNHEEPVAEEPTEDLRPTTPATPTGVPAAEPTAGTAPRVPSTSRDVEPRVQPSPDAGSTARARAVRFQAEEVVELLRQTAPAHLWLDILAEASAQIAGRLSDD